MTEAEWKAECARIAREAVPAGPVSPAIQPGTEAWAQFGRELTETILGAVERVVLTRVRTLERQVADLQREASRHAAE